jgi:hypothetical protein
MKLTIKIDYTKIRKRVPPCGGAMTPNKGKGVPYKRKDKRNKRWEE